MGCKCRNDDLIDVTTEQIRGYGTQVLSCEITAHSMEDCFIIKKSVLAVSSIYFTWREPTMCKEVHSQVDGSDMRSISHLLLLFSCVWQLRDLH